MVLLKVLQKLLKRDLKLTKFRYNDKVKSMLSTGSFRPPCERVRAMIGMQSKNVLVFVKGKSDHVLSNKLNVFFKQFYCF